MNNRKLWLVLALLLCVATAAAVPHTLAYVADRSNTVRNSFTLPPYAPPQPAQVQVEVVKIVTSLGKENISPEGFRFALLDTRTGLTYTLTTNAQGKAATTLTIAGPGDAYTYRLTEIDDGRENVTYSTESYDIAITPTVDATNCIAPRIAVNGAPVDRISVTFENLYDPGMNIPETGDGAHLFLWLTMLLLSSAGLLRCRKECVSRRP